MKTITLILASVLLSFIACKKVRHKNMTVIKDCTGSYLRYHNKDYLICNIESVVHYDNGTDVEASFTKLKNCDGSAKEMPTCLMAHKNEGWIEVTKIK